VFEKAGPSPCNKTFIVPITIIDPQIPSNAGGTCLLWYLNDVEYDCNEATLPPTWFYNCQQNPMAISSIIIPASCGQMNGGFTASVTGGVAPFTYDVINPITGAVVPNTNGVVANVGAGAYNVTVTDSKGCVEMSTITVTNPNPLAVVVNATPPTCGAANGMITLAVMGGTGSLSTVWIFNGVQIGTGTSISNLSSGTYYFVITDSVGCTTSGTVPLLGTPGVDGITSIGNPLCAGGLGSITIVPSGGTPTYSIVWTNGGLTGFAPTGVPAGTYSYTITDQSTPNACTFTGTATVVGPPPISATISTTYSINCMPASPYTGTCTVTVSGGTPPYSYSWDLANSSGGGYSFPTNPTTSGYLTGLPNGTITCTVIDGNGCEFVISDTIDCLLFGRNEALANLASIKAYPNPADAVVNLNVVLKQPDNVRIEIVDMNGRILNSQTFSRTNTIGTQFDVRALASGVYYIKLNTSEGVVTQKLFIE
jgi:hypothetical protein